MNAASVTCMVVVVASAAGVLAGAPPELASTLALAKSSACKQAAALIEQGDHQSALRTLQSAIASPFPWQIEVTNGYQNGFFLNALMGYCLEKADDPPKAYRAYQNSRAYIDEEKSIATPEPRLEVYVGIGRMCNAVGRYTDSFTWLDAARYEGAGDSNIVMAADRALAKRAVDIGDYYDAITNLEDLASVTVLTREEYKQLAQLYFWTHRDREGFRHLLNRLALLGIDEDLGMKDPMVGCFHNNIMRASDGELGLYYDVLGQALLKARSLEGDEDYLSQVVVTRGLMSKLYPFLPPVDDLRTVAASIDRSSVEIASGLRPSRPDGHGQAVKTVPAITKASAQNGSEGRPRQSEEVEDILMRADTCLARNKVAEAWKWYAAADRKLQGINESAHAYDGTSMANACQMGLQLCRRATNVTRAVTIATDGSLRAKCYVLATSTGAVAEAVLYGMPIANPVILAYISRRASLCARQGDSEEGGRWVAQYTDASGRLPLPLCRLGCALYLSQDKGERAFEMALFSFTHAEPNENIDGIDSLCDSYWRWASEEQMALYARAVRAFPVLAAFRASPDLTLTPAKGERALFFQQQAMERENLARKAFVDHDWQRLASVNMSKANHAVVLLRCGQALLTLGNTNAALECALSALMQRARSAAVVGGISTQHGGRDLELAGKCIWGLASNAVAVYTKVMQSGLITTNMIDDISKTVKND